MATFGTRVGSRECRSYPSPRSSNIIDLSAIDNCKSTTKMRTLISLARPLAAPSKILLRTYSSQSPSLIKINDIPAPNSGRIRIISLSRPEARNAISRQLLQELGDAVRSINAEYRWTNNKRTDGSVEVPLKQRFGGAAGEDVKGHTRAVIIASEVDSCFCAGADLKERRGMSEDEYVDMASQKIGSLTGSKAQETPLTAKQNTGLSQETTDHFRTTRQTPNTNNQRNILPCPWWWTRTRSQHHFPRPSFNR